MSLHFVELHFTQPGQRYFDIWLNRSPAIVKLDILQLAGARYKPIIQESVCAADPSGRILLNLVSYHDCAGKATISAIELLRPDAPSALTAPYDSSALQPLLRVNAGGPAVGTFQADHYASGGLASATELPSDLSGLAAPAPPAVYQSEYHCALEDPTDWWPRLNVMCQTRDDRLEFWITSYDNLHRRETIQALCQELLNSLRALI